MSYSGCIKMSALKQVMQVIGTHDISNRLLDSNSDKYGGLITNGQYAWFVSGANIILYSKQLGSVVSSRSFGGNQKDKSIKITYIKELKNNEETCNLILVGCSFKSCGILFVCQLPTLTTIRCIDIPNPITYIDLIMNESLAEDQLCDEFQIMSTILLVGMNSGAVYAVDLRQNYIETQLKKNEVVVNELRPNKLFIMRKNEDCAEVKEMSDDSDSHLAIFLNENFYQCCKKLYNAKLNLKVTSLLYIEEINTIAIGYSTGHFQLWDCKIMRTVYSLKEPQCVMPVTHINFLEPSDDPNNLCYLWIMQSDNTRLPNATMIALTYEQRTLMPNGSLSYRIFQGSGIKLEMSLRRETGIGRCISALSLCNVNLFRNETDMDEDCEIRLFSMLMEVRRNVDDEPETYIFLFDINQWYKAQMPSNITHLKVSNAYASFVKLPHNVTYLDFNISDKTLRPFGCNFRNNVEELYYPSSIYFECDCLVDTQILKFKHAGVQQEILDQLLLKNWRLLINPSLIFNQCLQVNLRPFFWDKSDDYNTYSLPDQRSFVISILVENKIMSVLSACAEEWKNGTYASSEATILHLVQCLWKHVMVVKQFADKLCVPLFDYSGTRLDKKNERILNHCLSQMQCVKHFLEDLHNAYGVHIINVDYSYRVYTLNLVTQYFKAVLCFLSYGLLPESIEQDPMQSLIQCDFTLLIQYANKRRMEFGGSQLYLIDAIVNNEPKGNKLIEQWQHEGGEETKGMYPPSNVQCLLRIYLNSALSDQVKHFITIYFLIDVCSIKELDVVVANRMCNFALEFDIPNKGLNALCRASWLLDHDMFEEAMEILAENKEWKIINDKSWDWFHWVVLKLLVFKSEYFWARYYMKLININLVNIDDQKFYINLQIMNDQSFDAINYIRARSPKEKEILFEYFFDRCKEVKKLKCLIEYLWEKEEEDLFFSYLERFKDAESLTFQLLFLLQRGKYVEAINLNKSTDVVNKLKLNDTLKITSNIVNGFEKSLPKSMRTKSCAHPVFKNLYKKRDIVVKCMNSDTKMFSITDRVKENIFKKRNSSTMSSNLINLIIPANNSIRKRSPINDVVHVEKRRKLNNDGDLLNPPTANENEILRPIGKHVLDILNTPLVEKTVVSPSVTNYSSILKTGSAKKHKRVLSIKDDEIPVSRTVLRFSLPGEDDPQVVQFDSEKSAATPETNLENESSSDKKFSNESNKWVSLSFKESSSDNSKMESQNSIINTDEKSSIESRSFNENICETGSAKKHETVLSIKDEEIPVSSNVMRFSLLDEDDTQIVQFDSEKSTVTPETNLENKNIYNIVISSDEELSNESNELVSICIKESPSDNSKIESQNSIINTNEKSSIESQSYNENICETGSAKKHETMLLIKDDEIPVSRNILNFSLLDEDDTQVVQFDSKKSTVTPETNLKTKTIYNIVISSDEELSNESNESVSISIKETQSDNSKIESQHSIINTDKKSSNESRSYNENICFPSSVINSSDNEYVKEQSDDDDDDVILLSSEDENSPSERSCSVNSSDVCSVSDESDLDITKYGRFKSHNRRSSEGTSEERSNVGEEEYDDQIDVEQSAMYSEENSSIEGEICSEDEIISSEDEEKVEQCDILSSDEGRSSDAHFNKSEEQSLENNKPYDLSENEDCDFKSNKLETLTSCTYDLTEENYQPNYDCRNEYVEIENDDIIVDEEKIIDSNIKYHDCYEEINKTGLNNKSTHFEEVEDNEICINQVENASISFENKTSNIKEVEDSEIYINQVENAGTNFENNSSNFKEVEDSEICINQVENAGTSLENKSSNFKEVEDSEICINQVENADTSLENKSSNFKEVEDSEICINQVENADTSLENKSSNFKEVEDSEICINQVENADTSLENKSSNLKEVKDSEICIIQVENADINVQEEYSLANNDNYFEMPNRETSPIPESGFNLPDNGFNIQDTSFNIPDNSFNLQDSGFNLPDNGFNLPATEIEPNQIKQIEVDTNQSTPFLFGESFFGQQEIPENKPMFLFGQVYSLEKEKFAIDSNNDKHEEKDSTSHNDKDVVINSETKEVVDLDDEIEDILELESLPESNPDENSDVPKSSKTNTLQPEFNENGKEFAQKSFHCESSEKIVSTVNESNLGSLDDTLQNTTQNLKKISNQTEESTQEVSNDSFNKQADDHSNNQGKRKRRALSIPPQNVDVIKTRSRAKSETKIIPPESSSLNIFRSSGIIEDSKRQVRVSLSKKRSKSQENLVPVKRRSGRSKSLAPIEEVINTRRTVFGLEQIPEEETTNSDKILQSKHTALVKKSKFKFLSNKSKLCENENLHEQEKKVKTPRRSKSVQPDTALTFSLVKTKPKRSSSVNLITDDKNSTNIDHFMGVLKKALVSPKKIKKRSLTESVESRKKQKYTKQVETDDVESDSNESNVNSNNVDSSASEELSPIAGNNSQHMLFTPAKRRTKIQMAELDSENENSSNESTDSKRIMTRSTRKSSFMELEHASVTPVTKINSKMSTDKQKNTSEVEKSSKKITSKADKSISLLPKRGIKSIKETIIEVSKNEPSTPERRITRSQKSLLDNSLQSTSIIGQDEAIQNVNTLKSDKKITKKKRNQ